MTRTTQGTLAGSCGRCANARLLSFPWYYNTSFCQIMTVDDRGEGGRAGTDSDCQHLVIGDAMYAWPPSNFRPVDAEHLMNDSHALDKVEKSPQMMNDGLNKQNELCRKQATACVVKGLDTGLVRLDV